MPVGRYDLYRGTNAQFYRTGDQLTTRARGVLTYGRARAEFIRHVARLSRGGLELYQ